MAKPEQAAREEIDRLLAQAGWVVCDANDANITADCGVAIREFPLKPGHGFADYMLYVDGKAAGVLEAKKAGSTLVGVQTQSARYTAGLPDALPSWRRPLAFAYESTGVETRFTNGLDAVPRSRNTFAFHRPETLAEWLADMRAANHDSAESSKMAEAAPEYVGRGATSLARVQHMRALEMVGLWQARITAGCSKVGAGYSVQIQERNTRKKHWEQMDDEFARRAARCDSRRTAPHLGGPATECSPVLRFLRKGTGVHGTSDVDVFISLKSDTAQTQSLSELAVDQQLNIGCALVHRTFEAAYPSGDVVNVTVIDGHRSLVQLLTRLLKQLQALGTAPAIDYVTYLARFETNSGHGA